LLNNNQDIQGTNKNPLFKLQVVVLKNTTNTYRFWKRQASIQGDSLLQLIIKPSNIGITCYNKIVKVTQYRIQSSNFDIRN